MTASSSDTVHNPLPAQFKRWFADRGWEPFSFQREVWAHYQAGRSGLLHAPTGMGKTLAVWLGPLIEWMAASVPDGSADPAHGMHTVGDTQAGDPIPGINTGGTSTPNPDQSPPPLTVLWITPLRALAQDTVRALREPVEEIGLPWTVELRSGDTSSSVKQRQRKHMPSALVTTPESLTLLLSYPESPRLFRDLRLVIVDEWHELLGSKRGVQTQLALARLRRFAPGLRTWGLSATLGNLDEARDVLIPPHDHPSDQAVLVSGDLRKQIEVESLLPETVDRFPWAGHMGLNLLDQVIARIDAAGSTLLFANTRNQVEVWYQALLKRKPDYAGRIALHHGSLDGETRVWVENGLADGSLTCVVCTSSLDLGVDFSPVDQVIQVGSPKGVARLLQRAGRSGHQPGRTSRIVCVAAHAFELLEFAAAREAVARGEIEPRIPPEKPIDVLAQHLVTMALAGGFDEAELLAEIRATWAFRDLTDEEWSWVMAFVTHGGEALKAYERYARVQPDGEGRYKVPDRRTAQHHRMSIGTITAESAIEVRFLNGHRLGSVEENFVGRMRKGDRFVFAGRILELVTLHGMTANVRVAKRMSRIVPRWSGATMPLSSELAHALQRLIARAAEGTDSRNLSPAEVNRREGVNRENVSPDDATRFPEWSAVAPLLALQRRNSIVPGEDELLIETTTTDDGCHAFLFLFAGRLVHEGLSALIAWRLTRQRPMTLTTTCTDYGIALTAEAPFEFDAPGWRELLSPDRLLEDVAACLNTSELARRMFRPIARIAGLIFQGYPGQQKRSRQLQASSDLFFDVFERYDPDNLLLHQAKREVLEQQLEIRRLRTALERAQRQRVVLKQPERLTPLAFPLWADRLREQQMSSEPWADRVRAMAASLEEAETGASDR